MKILSVRHAVPSTVLTNEDIVGRIVAASGPSLSADGLAALLARVRQFLDRVGTQTRHATDGREAAVDILRQAVDRALAAAGIAPADLDFIIYAGVNRGWLEPSSAALVQREIAAGNAVCFDIMEACASWLRAIQVAQAFFVSGTYRLGMIVNCECALEHLATYDLATAKDPDGALAGLTIGEAATATLVARSDDGDLYVTMRSFGEYCDLCMIPLANAGSYLKDYDPAVHPPGRFYSQSRALFQTTIEQLVDAYRNDEILKQRRHDIYFSHAASSRAGEKVRQSLNIPPERWYCTHSRFGNTVAASIPLGMSAALDDGHLRRGMRCLVGIGSAGISIGLASFTF